MVEGRNKNTCSIVGGISKRAGQLKLVIAGYFYTHMQPMVLVYLPTKLDDFVRANVGKYSSTMEHMGVGGISKIFQNHQALYTVFWYIMDRFGQWVYKQLEVRGDQNIPGFSWEVRKLWSKGTDSYGFVWKTGTPPQKKGWLKKYVFQSKDKLFKEVYIYIYIII